MLEGSIMEFVKWFVYLFLLFFALAIFMFFFEVSQTNRFEGYVNTQIERHAGLTPEAVSNIKMENENYYNGRYTVSIDPDGTTSDVTFTNDGDGYSVMNHELAYGDSVAYDVKARYEILFDWIDPIDMTTSGQAIIQVRGSAGGE